MSFTGFPSAGLALLTRLPSLDPAGFAAERMGWDTLLLEPARRFVTDLGAVLAERISPGWSRALLAILVELTEVPVLDPSGEGTHDGS